MGPGQGCGMRLAAPRRWSLTVLHGITLLVSLGASPASAGLVSLVASRDNTLFQDVQGDTSNGAGPAFFAGSNNQNLVRRALLRFELTGLGLDGAIIDKVELTLDVSSAPDTVSRSIALHRVLADWGEGISYSSGGGGSPATPGDATWLHARYPDSFWSAPGGDFVASPSATTRVGDVGSYRWSGAEMRADVQLWLTDPAANFGWLLSGESGAPRTVRRFDSRETDVPSRRPTLNIFYSEPVPSRPTTWGRLKALFR
jgi:hypothetical protein